MIRQRDIQHLLTQPGADRTLSLYLRVDPGRAENQASTPAWRVTLRGALRELRASARGDEILRSLCDRSEAFLEHYRAESKSLALFMTPKSSDIFALPLALAADEVAYGRPRIAPLLWLVDEYEPHVIVVMHDGEARFLKASLGRTRDEEVRRSEVEAYDFREKLQMPTGLGQGDRIHGGRGRDAHEATLADHERRFFREVAERCRELLEESGARRLVLAGSEVAAHGLKAELRGPVADALIGVVATANHLGNQQLLDRILPLAVDHERRRELELADEVLGLARAGGRGAIGLEATEAALDRAQVELLIVAYPLGDPEVQERLLHRALGRGAAVELVAGAAAERLREVDGVAARLFYAGGVDDTAVQS